MHLIVRIDGIPVEIQIRTELQDTWAQIVERLADRWGRGIRYGQEPELPDSLVRSHDFVVSRREAMSTLMSLGDAIAATERAQQGVNLSKSMLGQLDSNIQANLRSQVDPEALAEKIPTELDDHRQKVVAILAKRSRDLDDEGLALLSAGVDITWEEFMRMIETSSVVIGREVDARSAELRVQEQRLRGTLRLIAEATDEEGDQ